MFYKVYIFLALLVFLYLIYTANKADELTIMYVFISLICSLLWLPIFIVFLLGG